MSLDPGPDGHAVSLPHIRLTAVDCAAELHRCLAVRGSPPQVTEPCIITMT
ncbi:hypothetical protein ABI_09990 [Asticcacaulis biprosthecium C19]|uniref:Uncharacterized protein n=1 Tax=Asticcacaulis biprosthecium C19 TaxID=715226 RepID=F4QH24_9CAUL|nr:hypothetical protein ABI_09990 [Asticcacaulis biprosthecium C19]